LAETPQASLQPPPSVPSQVRVCDQPAVTINNKASALISVLNRLRPLHLISLHPSARIALRRVAQTRLIIAHF
jgi:hypothetical protein